LSIRFFNFAGARTVIVVDLRPGNANLPIGDSKNPSEA
jgi:hypothetical protein